MKPYILYGGTFTRALGPQMVLEEAGLSYELRVMDMDGGEHRKPDFLSLNPAGYVPALVTPEGDVLHEAAAIMLYLADRHGLIDLAPLHDDPQRGIFLAKFFYFTNDVQPAYKRFFYPHRYVLREGDIPAMKAKGHAAVCERLKVLDDWLTLHGPYHLGERISIADLYLAMWVAYGLTTTRETAEMFPAVGRMYELVRARPKSGPLIDGLVAVMDTRNANRARLAASRS